MILGINIPEGARAVIENGKVLIIFDEKQTKMDLWKARFDMWLTEGNSSEEFRANAPKDTKAIFLTNKNKLKFNSYGAIIEMKTKAYPIGAKVKVNRNNDNENYDKFRKKVLIVTHAATEDPGYDSTMNGEPLYSFETEDGEDIPFSLYHYELEKA